MKKIFIMFIISLLFISCDEHTFTNPADTDNELTPMTSNLSIEQLSDSSVQLSWELNPDITDHYKIERKINSGSYTLLTEIPPSQNNYTDSGLLISNTYYYRLTGCNDENTTGFIENYISTSFDSLSSFYPHQLNLTSALINWTHDCDYETGYILERREIIRKDLNTEKASSFHKITDTKKNIRDGFEIIAQLPANTFSYQDNDLLPNHKYEYRLKAFSEYNESNPVYNDLTMNFPVPSDLYIFLNTMSSCECSWRDNSEGESGFKIDRKKDSDEWEVEYQILEENAESFTDTDLEVYSTYLYRVYAYYENETSGSIEDEITMIFQSPIDFIIIQNSENSCILNWEYNETSGEEGFKLERRDSGNDWDLISTLSIDEREYEDTGLELEIEYNYKLYAYNSMCDGLSVIDSIFITPEGMVFVEGGSFEMGDHFSEGEDDELPVHSVTVNSFYMGQHEVTQGEYEAVMGSNPANGYGEGDNYPVYYVSWYDAVEYCNALSIQEGLTPCYDTSDWSCDFSADGYRLPTEAEWEYASRGGNNWEDDYRYSGTSDNIGDYAWYNSNSGSQTHEVETKFPNQLGILDMTGNVWEWCNDWYSSSYYGSSPEDNPVGPDNGSRCVVRGGCWYENAFYCRTSNRGHPLPGDSDSQIGFRILRAYSY